MCHGVYVHLEYTQCVICICAPVPLVCMHIHRMIHVIYLHTNNMTLTCGTPAHEQHDTFRVYSYAYWRHIIRMRVTWIYNMYHFVYVHLWYTCMYTKWCIWYMCMRTGGASFVCGSHEYSCVSHEYSTCIILYTCTSGIYVNMQNDIFSICACVLKVHRLYWHHIDIHNVLFCTRAPLVYMYIYKMIYLVYMHAIWRCIVCIGITWIYTMYHFVYVHVECACTYTKRCIWYVCMRSEGASLVWVSHEYAQSHMNMPNCIMSYVCTSSVQVHIQNDAFGICVCDLKAHHSY